MTHTNNLIEKDTLVNPMSYSDYRSLVEQLVEEKATTGNTQTEALVEYTLLNSKRMKRWDKTIKLTDEAIEKFKTITQKQTWIVLTESWCGDAAHIMPVLNKLASLNTNITFKVVLRDKNEALMDRFLTNGNRSIPKLIIANETQSVLHTYGPRPSAATTLVNTFKKEHGKLTPEFKTDLQRWYNKDKGQTVIKDLVGML